MPKRATGIHHRNLIGWKIDRARARAALRQLQASTACTICGSLIIYTFIGIGNAPLYCLNCKLKWHL